MKKIPNAQTEIPLDENRKPATYADLLRVCLDMPPPGGFTLELIRKRARVETTIADAKPGGNMTFEDADFSTAQEAIKLKVWPIRHSALAAFAEAFGV